MMKGLRMWKTTPRYSGSRMKNFVAFKHLPVVIKGAVLLSQTQFILKCRETANYRLTLFKICYYLSVGRD